MEQIEHRVIKVEKDISTLTSHIDDVKKYLSKLDDSMEKLINLQTDTKLLEEKYHTAIKHNDEDHKRLNERIDKINQSIIWITRSVVGAFITGTGTLIFFLIERIVK